MAVTIKDVARESGVNISTVSRSLNGSYGVHPETRDKVLAVAERLKYRPNRVARGLATGKSNTFGLIVSDVRNPYFAEVARGAEDAAHQAGCDIVLCNSDLDAAKQMRYVHSLCEKRVDGILMNSVAALSRAQQESLTALGIPIVLLSRMAAERFFSTVTADNHMGGYLAGRYLTQLGHRFIAHVTGPKRHGNFSERTRGFLKAIEESRKTVKPVIMHGAQSFKGGYDMVKHLIEKHPETTAIFTGNDIMAFGAMRALYEMGLRIPKDVSLIGFDNLEFSSLLHPPLTTVHQPKYEMGQAAVELLLKLGKRDGRTPEHRMLGVELIERESCMRR